MPPNVINIEDLRRLAQRRLPKVVFDYLDGGAEGEVTLRENSRAFERVTFRPRHAVAVPRCDLRTSVLGIQLSFPVLLAPIGYNCLLYPDGDLGTAGAADTAGTIYILSTFAGHALEAAKAATSGSIWYQIYLTGGRDVAQSSIERAKKAGFAALVVTIDTAVSGLRERDYRNHMVPLLGANPFAKIPYLLQFLTHPRWTLPFLLNGGTPMLPNIVIPGEGPMPLIDASTALARSVVTWQDLKWIREVWQGPIVVKGVLTAEDAKHALDEGAAAIVVSNHGGRQLDYAPATLRVLPEIVDAVRGKAEVLMDGGIRRGSDIAKAICLGARAVLIGRAYAYGLAIGGRAGVARALEILRTDMERTLTLLGCQAVEELDRSYVTVPTCDH